MAACRGSGAAAAAVRYLTATTPTFTNPRNILILEIYIVKWERKMLSFPFYVIFMEDNQAQ